MADDIKTPGVKLTARGTPPAAGAADSSIDIINEESDLGLEVMNAVAAAIGMCLPILGAEDRIHKHLEFFSARRVSDQEACRVVVETTYAAGPAVGKMTVSCWVHDEESECIPGGRRVSDLREDPILEFA